MVYVGLWFLLWKVGCRDRQLDGLADRAFRSCGEDFFGIGFFHWGCSFDIREEKFACGLEEFFAAGDVQIGNLSSGKQ